MTPATLLRWHRELVARRWTTTTGRGQRGLDPEIVDLVVRMARENPRWGYPRIVGECRKLGIRVSATSVRRILRRHRLGPAPRPGPSWTAFLRARSPAYSRDFLSVEHYNTGRPHRGVGLKTPVPVTPAPVISLRVGGSVERVDVLGDSSTCTVAQPDRSTGVASR